MGKKRKQLLITIQENDLPYPCAGACDLDLVDVDLYCQHCTLSNGGWTVIEVKEVTDGNL